MISEENINGLEEALNGDIQNIYAELFGKGFGDGIVYVKAFKNFTGIKPNYENSRVKKSVNKIYLTLFKKGWVYPIKELTNFTGTEPNYKTIRIRDAVQKGYLNDLADGFISDAKELKEYTGIQPSKELLAKCKSEKSLYLKYVKVFGDPK